MIFSEYMDKWLYGDEGYYTKYRPIGKKGDFYTAVSTSPFFGASIANFLCDQIEEGKIPSDATLVEIGAHHGYLIADMIQWIYTRDPSLLDSMSFVVVEREERIREAQKGYFDQRFGDEVEIIQVDSLDSLDLDYAFFVSNEIFDAFVCELYINERIASVVDNAIVWQDAPKELIDHARRYGMNKGEIALGYEEFARRATASAKSFDFVSFDYGDKYARDDFSIRIYARHKVYPFFDEDVDLGELFGVSDITYDVNFGHLIDAFKGAGVKLEMFETQARALVRFGIIELLEQYSKQAAQAQYLSEADKIKNLIAPNVMGGRFKMVHLSRRG